MVYNCQEFFKYVCLDFSLTLDIPSPCSGCHIIYVQNAFDWTTFFKLWFGTKFKFNLKKNCVNFLKWVATLLSFVVHRVMFGYERSENCRKEPFALSSNVIFLYYYRQIITYGHRNTAFYSFDYICSYLFFNLLKFPFKDSKSTS